MCGDNKSYRGIFRFAERTGMLLLECLLAASLLALMVSAWPAAVSWHEEYVLYLAAKELQMAIREAQVQAKNDDVHYRGATEGVIFRCFMRNGRVRYETYRGVERTHPSGNLPCGVSLSGNGTAPKMVFCRDGFAGRSRIYSYRLTSGGGKHALVVVCAMYTGRVQIRRG